MMLPVRALRTSLALLIGATAVLGVAACSDGIEDELPSSRSGRKASGDDSTEPSGSSGSENGGNTPGGNGGGATPGAPAGGSTTPGGGSTTPAPTQAQGFDVLLDKPEGTMNLAEKLELTATVASKGSSGAVALSAVGVPEGVKVTFEPASVTISAAAGASAKVIIESATDAVPGIANINIEGLLAGVKGAAALKVDIKSRLVVNIPANIDQLSANNSSQNPKRDAFGAYPIRIKAPQGISAQNPVTVVFRNADSTPHQIHAGDNGLGFPHGRNDIPAGGNEPERRISGIKMQNGQPAQLNFYLHDQGTAKTQGALLIVP